MTTTQTDRPSTRSWDGITRWLLLVWVAVGFFWFLTHGSSTTATAIYVWLAVQVVLTVGHIALGVRRKS